MVPTIDLASLTPALSRWEFAGYVAVTAVAIGVIGESIHELTNWFKPFRWWKANGGRASALLLIVALAVELVTQIMTNSISGQIIGLLNIEVADARNRTADIEKLTAWRWLPPDSAAAKRLVDALSSIPASVPHSVVFSYAQNDMESLYFASQIGQVFLNSNKWTINVQSRSYPGQLYWGVRILGPDNETTRSIRKAFTDSEIEFLADDIPGGFSTFGYMLGAEDTVILVGPKKPPLVPSR
jgi:hypothetical protein